MELIIIRHSVAAALGVDGAYRDQDRGLTHEGLERIEGVAGGLKAMGIQPESILTSPAKRTLQTALALQKGLGTGKNTLVESPSLALDGTPEQVMEELNRTYPHAGQLILVGHQPGLTQLIGLLIAGNSEIGMKMGRASATCLEARPPLGAQRAVLLWKMTARQLIAFGR